MGALEEKYEEWRLDPRPETLGPVIRTADPFITQEIQNYSGPKDILHTKAKRLAIDAIRKYDPSKGTNLRTWITGQLRPLSRYSRSLEAVKDPEVASQKAAEINRIYEDMHDRLGRYPTDEELSDEIGIPQKKLKRLRSMSGHRVSESQYTSTDSGDVRDMPGVSSQVTPQYAYEAVYMGLDPREKVIMDWKTGSRGKDRLSNAEIAERLGVSPAYVSQVSYSVAKKIERVLRDV